MIDDIARGLRTLEEIIGQPVTCSAAAGWRADQKVIEAKEAFHLRYNSDCRGAMPFRPLLESGNPPKGLAIITEFGGVVQIKDTKKKREITVTDNETGNAKTYLIPYGSRIKVMDGQVLEAGDEPLLRF